jgi:hypothetical protein
MGLAIAATGVTLAVLLWTFARWAAFPAAVPDHATIFSGTNGMAFAGQNSLAQRLVPRGDRLLAIDLLLAAENPNLPGYVQIEVVSLPDRTTLRRSQRPASDVPVGEIWRVRPGEPGERWTSFGFEPIDGTGGKELLFVLSYPDGANRPGERLVTLAHFPGHYPDGELFVNGAPNEDRAGDLLFRAARAGTRGGALGVALENLARVQPVAPGTLSLPLWLGAGTLALAGALAAVLSGRLR